MRIDVALGTYNGNMDKKSIGVSLSMEDHVVEVFPEDIGRPAETDGDYAREEVDSEGGAVFPAVYAIQIPRTTCLKCITNFTNLECGTCHAALGSEPPSVMQKPHPCLCVWEIYCAYGTNRGCRKSRTDPSG